VCTVHNCDTHTAAAVLCYNRARGASKESAAVHPTEPTNSIHCTALHCTVLYCTLLFSTPLYCTILYSTALHFGDTQTHTHAPSLTCAVFIHSLRVASPSMLIAPALSGSLSLSLSPSSFSRCLLEFNCSTVQRVTGRVQEKGGREGGKGFSLRSIVNHEEGAMIGRIR
jgi:hypothetical protein